MTCAGALFDGRPFRMLLRLALVVQRAGNDKVLMLGYVNRVAPVTTLAHMTSSCCVRHEA
jgi:hypothetical protein